MSEAGYHKQVANRILEPFQFISVIVTTTEWDNFFQLRDHEDAQPEIRELAIQMKQALAASTPKRLNYGEWHLPYVSQEERRYYATDSLRKLSAARCARVSYLTHDGREPNPEEDFKLFDRLVGSVPLHASPIEHQATPDHYEATGFFTNPSGFAHPELWGNFKTWVQHRKVWEQAIFAQSNQGNNA
jgi:thymidylate synthase ThyX